MTQPNWQDEKRAHAEAKAAQVEPRRSYTCAHCSRDMRTLQYGERCSNGAYCVSIEDYDAAQPVENTDPLDWNGRPYCAQLREELAEAKKAQQVAVDACWEAAGERDDLKVQLTAANARIQELTCKVAPPTEETPLPHGETPADREAAKFLRQSFNGPPSEQAETFSRQLCMTVRILSLRDHELRAALRRAETAEAVLNSLSNYEPNTVLEIIDSALSFTKPLSSTGAQSQPQQEGKTSMSEAPKCICGATKERKFFMGGYPPIWRCKACEYAAAPPSTQQPEGEK